MPNGIFPIPGFRSQPAHSATSRPSLAVRIGTRWRRNRLDEQLAHGAEPGSDPELNLRAAQLRSPAERSRLANELMRTLGNAGKPELVPLKPRPQSVEVLKRAEALLAIVERLRDDQPVGVQGVAMTARLLTDSTGPLHRDGQQDLDPAIRATRRALDAAAPATRERATPARANGRSSSDRLSVRG